MTTDIKISTITASTQFPNCSLNLTNIGKYLPIDNDIVGIKYKYGVLSVTKGKYSTTIYKKSKSKNNAKINKALFYNQISIVVNNNGNHVNVKLFNNGSLHLTGCKTLDEGREVAKLLYSKLESLRNKTDSLLLTMDRNGIYLDKDNLVYSYTTHQIIGHYLNNVYVIHNKEYHIDVNTGMFIGKKLETGRKKQMLNLDGEPIGYWQIELLQNKAKLYRKNDTVFYDFSNGFVYHNDKNIIGKFVYHIQTDKMTHREYLCPVKEIAYHCNPYIDNNYRIEQQGTIPLDIHCANVYFGLDMVINRQKLYERFIEMDYICKYKPESYSGVKLTYKLPLSGCDYTGYCKCTNKCTCRNITFMIFQTGNVIGTGFKTMDEIDLCCKNFIAFCKTNKDVIVKNGGF
jgi:TATA-box binding protein (TBP) (component of TFIID and TFIIIB)